MEASEASRKRLSRFDVLSWPVWQNSGKLLLLLGTVEFSVLIIALRLASGFHLSSHQALEFTALLGCALLFEEIERGVAHFLSRLRDTRYTDMTSVWIIAGVIVLRPLLVVVFITIFRIYLWIRQQRREGVPAYRRVFTWASHSLSALAAAGVLVFMPYYLQSSPHFFAVPILYALVALAYMTVNDITVGLAVFFSTGSRKPSELVGDFGEKMLEIATLCLGVLLGLACLRQPSMVIFAIPSALVLERASLVRKLEQDASTDAKTGLLNAPTWHRIGVRELGRAERERYPIAVLLLDLDHFKAVNDSYGHLVGDQAILAIADLLRHEMRDYDSIGRFGGEEFVALLPRASVHEAFSVAERVREQVRELRLDAAVPGRGPALSLSIGLACFPDHGATMDELLQAADTALYRAKNGGRNKVVVSSIGESGDEVVGRHVTGPMPPLF
ncbi:diguanylate cyclase (GGDEF) domain-containing protein [Frankineae bacterium MT45]|nr:diguanylate cyclase (GGDEF) domain-containing protein [Frankineae bacterium MT45]